MAQTDVEINSKDLYDVAYKWAWEQPSLHDLVYLCYKTPDFAENARRYRSSGEFQEAMALLARHGLKPGPGKRVLDFGCGNGVGTYSLASAGFEAIGIDSSSGKLAGLGAANRLLGLDGARFELRPQRGKVLDFPDNSFDLVWMREVLHHMGDLPSFLAGVLQILKPGGLLLCLRDVVVWNEEQRTHFFATHPLYPITHDEGCFPLQEYRDSFRAAGFQTELELDPVSSPINTYPGVYRPGLKFDARSASSRREGYDLFTFLVRKPEAAAWKAVQSKESAMNTTEKNAPLGEQKDALRRVLNHMETKRRMESPMPAPAPASAAIPATASTSQGESFYGPALVNRTTLRNLATAPETWDEILAFHGQLATDPYVAFVDRYYRSNRERFGRNWFYLDVVNVLYASAKALRPRHYLEIGVRRGRSVCTVARACPDVHVHAFDMWVKDYAGMENPGPEFVCSELRKHGHRGEATFVDGDSHQTLHRYFAEYPDLRLDMVLVDGDHSDEGALADLSDVIPRLAPGGILVFDDIAHPSHPGLLSVWRKAVARPELSAFEFTEAGYGVAFAIKKTA